MFYHGAKLFFSSQAKSTPPGNAKASSTPAASSQVPVRGPARAMVAGGSNNTYRIASGAFEQCRTQLALQLLQHSQYTRTSVPYPTGSHTSGHSDFRSQF